VTSVTSVADSHLAALRRRWKRASLIGLADGTRLVTVPGMSLPDGWNQTETTVHFLVPVGFPISRPDCFYADANLKLANGNLPMNANVQAMPGSTSQQLWFSWHLASWNPAVDTLMTFMRVIEDRLRQAR
jgi:hypothetical protein